MTMSLIQGMLEIDISDLASHSDFELESARRLIAREISQRKGAVGKGLHRSRVLFHYRMDFSALKVYAAAALRGADKAISIELKKRAAREQRIEHVKGIIEQYGLNVRDLQGPRHEPEGQVRAKYRDPIDPSHTWSGRGRAPLWFREAKAHGLTESDLRGR
ncbi:H-NS family nucleoid-associated regulatory protein [Cupriavidus sp. TMH.W2]|uniref:H-NS histone family protein n=1 Tax=Cupriavidus sp. TMH.W2 TaxID=3434465 RepID=UPI003D7821D8